jgi:hypothetical protein
MSRRDGSRAKLALLIRRIHDCIVTRRSDSLFLRNAAGTAFDGMIREMDTRRLQHFLGHASNTMRYTAMSPEPFKGTWKRPMRSTLFFLMLSMTSRILSLCSRR